MKIQRLCRSVIHAASYVCVYCTCVPFINRLRDVCPGQHRIHPVYEHYSHYTTAWDKLLEIITMHRKKVLIFKNKISPLLFVTIKGPTSRVRRRPSWTGDNPIKYFRVLPKVQVNITGVYVDTSIRHTTSGHRWRSVAFSFRIYPLIADIDSSGNGKTSKHIGWWAYRTKLCYQNSAHSSWSLVKSKHFIYKIPKHPPLSGSI